MIVFKLLTVIFHLLWWRHMLFGLRWHYNPHWCIGRYLQCEVCCVFDTLPRSMAALDKNNLISERTSVLIVLNRSFAVTCFDLGPKSRPDKTSSHHRSPESARNCSLPAQQNSSFKKLLRELICWTFKIWVEMYVIK